MISKDQWEAPGCLHLGAKPRAYCYCGGAVSYLHWVRVQDFLLMLRVTLGRGWCVVRDAAGKAERMEWQS